MAAIVSHCDAAGPVRLDVQKRIHFPDAKIADQDVIVLFRRQNSQHVVAVPQRIRRELKRMNQRIFHQEQLSNVRSV